MANTLKDRLTEQFRAVVDVPILDPEQRQRSRLLNVLLLGLGIIVLLGLIITVFVSWIAFDESPYLFYSTQFSIIITLGVIYVLNRRGWGRLARSLFLGFILIVLLFIDDPEQIAHGRSVITFTIPIIMAGVLFPPYTSFIVAGIASAEIALVSLRLGRIPDPFSMLTYFTIALCTWLMAYTMQRAIDEFRRLNKQLDQHVQERTRDLTQALDREHALAERERTMAVRNTTVLNSIADGVLVLDADENVVIANPAASHMAAHNLESTNLTDLLTLVNDKVKEDIKLWLSGQRPTEMDNIRFEWNDLTISANISPVVLTDIEEKDISIGNVMVLRDFTKEAELEKAKDIFLSMVSHELRTPLTAIRGFAEILSETTKTQLPESDYQLITIIYDSARQMHGLVEDLLDISRIETGQIELYCQWINLPDILEKAANTVSAEFSKRELSLQIEYKHDVPELYLDPNRMIQVLLNLLSNAYKYTEVGGATITVNQANEWVTVDISDTGIGIKTADQEKLFSRFFRANDKTVQKIGGTGLGLNISKGLIELHGGTLTFESDYGKGTTFTMSLPQNGLTPE